MSINSLQNRMEQRAASMAQMAQRASNPNEIMSIQQRLVSEVQNGTIKPYVGIPLIQELTKQLEKAKAQTAMSAMGAPVQGQGMAPTPPQVPVAQQVMEQATQSQGVEALPSNLPQDYAGGGIIAFEGGGQVERYQNKGYTGDPMGSGSSEMMGYAGTADPYVGRGLLGTLLFAPEDPKWKREEKLKQALQEKNMAVTPPATPAAPPASPDAIPYDPHSATLRKDYESLPGGPASTPGGINFKLPTLPTVNLPKGPLTRNTETGDLYEAPLKVTDYEGIVGMLPGKIKKASEDAVKQKQKELEDIDDPLFKAREEKLFAREGQLGKDAEISRLLSIMKGGLKAAAGKSPIALINIAEGGEEGVSDLIKGEAARRAAKDKLDDYRDNLTMQKSAAKKGNIATADAAGERAGDNLRQATMLQLTGAHYGNSEAVQQQQLLQTGALGKAQLEQTGALGIAGLGLQAQGLGLQAKQLEQTAAYQDKMLGMYNKRYEAMDRTAQARMMQIRAGATKNFDTQVAPQLVAQLTSQYGKNWQTSQDPRSLEAQRMFNVQKKAYVLDALGQIDMSTTNARDADSLLGQ